MLPKGPSVTSENSRSTSAFARFAAAALTAALSVALCCCLAGCGSQAPSSSSNASAGSASSAEPEATSFAAGGVSEKKLTDEQRAQLDGQPGAGANENANAGAGANGNKAAANKVPAAPKGNLKLDDVEDNIFLDALEYLGYGMQKHRADGMMWEYVLWTDKDWRGWLSNITYGAGSTGFETNAEGKPDVAAFEQGGLVCATYATYVYFNYLPNVVGVDVSMLAEPDYSPSSNSVYQAAKQWVEDGYSRYIDFTCSESANWLTFGTEEEIPVGSLIFFTDAKDPSDISSHVVAYAGYRNGYHWVTHVGNDNGPEFCAVERMHYGPDPQWPIAIVSRPNVVG